MNENNNFKNNYTYNNYNNNKGAIILAKIKSEIEQ